MRFRPSSTAFGCCSLLLGVEIVAIIALVFSSTLIAICSSHKSLTVFGLTIGPEVQVCAAAWGFAGIICAVSGGVGVMYRMEYQVRVFFYYELVSWVLGIAAPLYYLASGSVCDAVVDKDLQRMGSSFVCSFTDTFIFTWTLILGLMHAYMTYVVWSAAEDIAMAPFPDLLRYSDTLKGVRLPGPPKFANMEQTRAFPGKKIEGPPPAGVGAEAFPITGESTDVSQFMPPMPTLAGNGYVSNAKYEGAGVPQSFVPSPSWQSTPPPTDRPNYPQHPMNNPFPPQEPMAQDRYGAMQTGMMPMNGRTF